jgi:molybdopterin synthase sulfur carrier subunit
MSIKVLYFASLREEVGRSSDIIDFSADLSSTINIEQLWKKATGQDAVPGHLLVAVNQEYTDSKASVNDGDEVAFFPPVTGG